MLRNKNETQERRRIRNEGRRGIRKTGTSESKEYISNIFLFAYQHKSSRWLQNESKPNW